MSRWQDWAKMQRKMREPAVLREITGRVTEEAKPRTGRGWGAESTLPSTAWWDPRKSWLLGHVSRQCYMRVLKLSHATTCPRSHRERKCWHLPPGALAPSRRFSTAPSFSTASNVIIAACQKQPIKRGYQKGNCKDEGLGGSTWNWRKEPPGSTELEGLPSGRGETGVQHAPGGRTGPDTWNSQGDNFPVIGWIKRCSDLGASQWRWTGLWGYEAPITGVTQVEAERPSTVWDEDRF